MQGASGSSLDLYPELFHARQSKGVRIRVKSLIWVWEKLQSPTNDLMVLISVGGLATLMALICSCQA